MKSIAQPNFIVFDKGEYFPICQRIHISDNHKLLIGFNYPCEELTEEGERRIGDYDIGFIAQGCNFRAAEVSVTIKVSPFKVVEVYASVTVNVVVEDKDFTAYGSLCRVELRSVLFKQRGLVRCLVFLAFGRIRCRNELFSVRESENVARNIA